MLNYNRKNRNISTLAPIVFALIAVFKCLSFASVATPKIIVLTFDDGPHPIVTEKLLSVLNSYEVSATFFLVGKMIEKHPNIVRKIYSRGHEIANHTYTHPRLTELSGDEIKEELNKVNDILEEIIGKKTGFFRPPGGRLNNLVLDIARSEGYHLVLWTRYVNDLAPGASIEKIIKRATSNPREFEIIMMHDGPKNVIKALPAIIKFYKNEGYEFTTVSKINRPVMARIPDAVVRKNISEWPIALWGRQYAELIPVKEEAKGRLIGIFALFASLGTTVYFVRLSKNNSKKMPVSLVFLGMKKIYFKKVLKILEEKEIKATFFLSEKDVEELKNIKSIKDEIQRHNIAYLSASPSLKEYSENGERTINRWKNKLGKFMGADFPQFSIIPFYYSRSGYANEEVKYLKAEGFLPVDWRMPPPSYKLKSKDDVVSYVTRKLKNQKVIPLWGDSKEAMGALPGIIKSVSEKGYYFLSLGEYVIKKFIH